MTNAQNIEVYAFINTKKRRPLAVFSESLFEKVSARHDRSETKGTMSMQERDRAQWFRDERVYRRTGSAQGTTPTRTRQARPLRESDRHDRSENRSTPSQTAFQRKGHFPRLSTRIRDKRDTRAGMIDQVACRCPATTSGIPVTGSYIITVYTFHDGNMTESASTLNIGLKHHNRWHVRSRGDNPTVSRGLICPLVGIAKPGDPATS